MTYFDAQELIDNEQKHTYYNTSPFNTGEVAILIVGEDGFFYTRQTEYMRTVGIAELLCDNFTIDINKWRFSEIVVKDGQEEYFQAVVDKWNEEQLKGE